MGPTAGKAAANKLGRRLKMLRMLLLVCFRTHATDLHLETRKESAVVRLRIDGTMVDAIKMDPDTHQLLTGLVKVLSDIDISRRNSIQEGHFSAVAPGREADYRVSFSPAMYGQKLVIRVLDLANAPKHTTDLKLPAWMLSVVRKISKQDAGMVLVCGPTGSGKTTTLYAVLRDINVKQRNVITIEDPVEYQLEGVTQIPIDEKGGSTFNSLLRAVLRQDPDVILLGEVRDADTARTAMQAAMTGHLVLSTVHAKDTMGTLFRLLDLGVEPYLIASSLNVVIAQRLVRLLCPHCRQPRPAKPRQSMALGKFVEGIEKVYIPGGCKKCFNTGFNGRKAVFELLTVTDDMRDIILQNPSIQAMRGAIQKTMFSSLRENAAKLVADGEISFEELERITGSD